MHRGIAFFALLLCILPSLLAQQPCTASDYVPSYTACDSNGFRQVVWSLRTGDTCSGGVSAPPTTSQLCNISCSAGYYLPVGATSCSPCGSGQFSIGNGYREDTWYSWPSFFNFSRYFFQNSVANSPHNTTGQDTSSQWGLKGVFLRSGNITHLYSSVLELNVTIVTPGSVSFTYRVDAELNFDGLQFEVDGRVVMAKVSYTTSFVPFSTNLTVGNHTLRWVYYKDVSVNKGEDAAFLQMIQVHGEFFAADACEVCPPGTFNNKTAAASCMSCPANTFSNTPNGAAQCTACDPKSYSYAEAEFCLPRLNCTEDDYEFIYTPCDTTGHRSLYAQWLNPIICDTSTYTLPPGQTNLACGECSDGSTRNPTTDQCEYCPNGTYSTGGAPCTPCPAGTAAIKVHDINQFNDWVPGATTDCSGDCTGQGWELHSTYMDSGEGHGEAVNSWFSFNTTLIADGTISIMYRTICESASCNFEFARNGVKSTIILSNNYDYTTTYTLTAGSYVLNWTFSKFESGRSDRAIIKSIVITHTLEGGAASCTTCSGNTISAGDSTFCSPCPAGNQADSTHTQCGLCPDGTFSITPGADCNPCGAGTTSFANRTGCNVTCTYFDGTRLYDLNPLRTNAPVYGPINDTSIFHYYVTVCGSLPDVCYDTKDTFIHSYICQQTTILLENNEFEGVDLGEVLGWAPLPQTDISSDLGVVMTFTYGTAALGCGRDRDSKITFLCDPTAGVGSPQSDGPAAEHPICTYNFVWRSQYACPICDPNYDADYYYSQCQQGQRTKTYFWLEDRSCYGGPGLPAPQTEACVSCTAADYVESYTECHALTNTRDVIFYPKRGSNCSTADAPAPIYGLPCNTHCPPGQYLPMGTTSCVSCSPGSFSIGGGYREDTWYEWPSFFRFTRYYYTNSATRPVYNYTESDQQWHLEDGVLRSGNLTNSQTAALELTVFVVSPSAHVSFSYRVNAELNYDGIQFEVDNVFVLRKTSYANNFVTFTTPLTVGAHVLRWTYFKDGSLSKGEDAAYIQVLEVSGLSYADESCEKCSEGTFMDKPGATDCLPCAANSFSGLGYSLCSPCASNQYSFSEASSCETRLPCTAQDYEFIYSPCSNGVRTKYAQWLTPIICDTNSATLPPSQNNVPCGECSDGSTRNSAGQCVYCPDGQNSTGGAACQPCPAGSAAIKTHVVNQFDDWVPGSSTDCSGDCYGQGWELHSTEMDSGEGHGRFATAWFQFPTSLMTSGQITFDYQLICPTSDCNLAFSVDGVPANVFSTPTTTKVTYTLALTAGDHNLNWTFSKFGFGNNRNDKAVLTRIVITHTVEGGAATCTKCTTGTVSSVDSTHCTTCDAGYQSNAAGTQCDPCPDGWFNPSPGGTCQPCGNGTTSFSNHTGCLITCTYFDGSRTYDLNPLKLNAPVYGPVNQSNMQYYISICGSLPDVCYSSKDTFIHSYACQQTPSHIAGSTNELQGEDLGTLLNWSPLPTDRSLYNNTQYGVTMTFQHGTPGCAASYHNVNIDRETNIVFICDPSAGIGAPTANGSLENSPCKYSFLWRSLYACPVCDSSDMGYYFSPCQDGQRTKEFYWLSTNRACHGGVLPDPEVVTCSETTARCPAGTYLSADTNQCTNCSAGTYSVGGGELINTWIPLPSRFSTSCTGAGCSGWVAGPGGEGTISSGNSVGTSTLTASFNFVVQGSINFQYKAYTTTTERFGFAIDNIDRLGLQNFGTSQLGWTNFNFTLNPGVHTFAWSFVRGDAGNATIPRTGAVIHRVSVLGTDYHDDTCTPCPSGFFSPNGGSAYCMPCGLNAVSSDDASSCTACKDWETSVFHGSTCIGRVPCTAADWGYSYSACFANGTRLRTPTYLDPMICLPLIDLPQPDLVPCAPCPSGTYATSTPGQCAGCPPGQVYSNGACTAVPAGYVDIRRKLYFFAASANSTLPSDWTTSCSGDCGSMGWRLRGDGSIDSGSHLTNAVDSLLTFNNTVESYGSISFNYDVLYNGSNGLNVYVNGGFVKLLTGVGAYSQALRPGLNTVILDYWQTNGTQGRALLSNIVVSGSLEADAGSESMECPAGSVSSAPGASECALCTPGYFASSSGMNACEPCPMGEYTSDNGTSQCRLCRGQTYTNDPGSSYCLSECTFASSVMGDIKFSLKTLPALYNIRIGTAPNAVDYYVNFCNASVATAPCDPHKPTHACAVEPPSTNRNWGGDFNFEALHNTEEEIFSGSTNTTFLVSFENGDSTFCPAGTNRSINFRFSCNADAGIGSPVALPRNFNNFCTATFEWASIVGCPVCKDENYAEVASPCVSGSQVVNKVRLIPCNGATYEYVRTQKCGGTVSFPIGAVFAVLAVILALIIGAAIIIIKNRKMSTQFQRLKMNGRGLDTASTMDDM